MKVTYLGHSGFVVETTKAIYIFDYIRGKIPKECYDNDKLICVFVSHAHRDHFSPDIFDLNLECKNVKYILSYDVVKKIKHTKKFRERLLGCDIVNIRYDESVEIDEIIINTLKSTDEGVAFIITETEGVIYHAGDLNWWQWEEESKAWNRNMEVNYKREVAKLQNQEIDIAFLPLDPRQEGDYWIGMQYFLENVAVKKAYPMHFWEEPEIMNKYLSEHGMDNKKIETEIITNIYNGK